MQTVGRGVGKWPFIFFPINSSMGITTPLNLSIALWNNEVIALQSGVDRQVTCQWSIFRQRKQLWKEEEIFFLSARLPNLPASTREIAGLFGKGVKCDVALAILPTTQKNYCGLKGTSEWKPVATYARKGKKRKRKSAGSKCSLVQTLSLSLPLQAMRKVLLQGLWHLHKRENQRRGTLPPLAHHKYIKKKKKEREKSLRFIRSKKWRDWRMRGRCEILSSPHPSWSPWRKGIYLAQTEQN